MIILHGITGLRIVAKQIAGLAGEKITEAECFGGGFKERVLRFASGRRV
jgi:hypothetical protein